jgi:hypothetical protein
MNRSLRKSVITLSLSNLTYTEDADPIAKSHIDTATRKTADSYVRLALDICKNEWQH